MCKHSLILTIHNTMCYGAQREQNLSCCEDRGEMRIWRLKLSNFFTLAYVSVQWEKSVFGGDFKQRGLQHSHCESKTATSTKHTEKPCKAGNITTAHWNEGTFCFLADKIANKT